MAMAVTLLHQGNRAPGGCFRRDVADGRASGAAAEAAVREQGHILVQTHTGNRRGGGKHLPHSWSALGALVPDDDDVIGLNLSSHDRLGGLFFRIKNPRPTFPHQHLGIHGGLFDHRPLRRQIAAQNGDTTLNMVGILQVMDNVPVQHLDLGQIFPHGLAGGGNCFPGNKPRLLTAGS